MSGQGRAALSDFTTDRRILVLSLIAFAVIGALASVPMFEEGHVRERGTGSG
jgi:hypothetical protein